MEPSHGQHCADGRDPVPGPVEAGQVGFGGFIRGGLARQIGALPVPGADVGRNGLATWLLAHQTTEDWIAATSGAMDAASLQLAARRPVMAMGGFIGGDPSPTLAQLQALVAEDRLRYVLLPSGRGIGGFLGGSNNRTRDGWVRATCVAVTNPSLGGSAGQRASLYDCAPGRTGSVADPFDETPLDGAVRDRAVSQLRRSPGRRSRARHDTRRPGAG